MPQPPLDLSKDPATGLVAQAAVAGRAARGGAVAGAVAAAPALGSAGLSSLLAACASCLGAGPAVAAGAATGVGVSTGGVVVGLLALLAVAAVQVLRVRRTCSAGPVRRDAVRRQVLTLVVVAGLSFAALQWVVAPWLTPKPPAAGTATLP